MSRRRRAVLFTALSAAAAASGLTVWDLLQTKHSVLRNYPLVGHLRYLFETIRPEIQQYFIESDWDGRPFDRDTRTIIYARAKGDTDEQAYGTELDVEATGAEYLVHSMHPYPTPDIAPRTRVGGPDCSQPYDMSLMNVSGMSFGTLSHNAIRALNKGAAMGGFAHDTGEVGSPHTTRNTAGSSSGKSGPDILGPARPMGISTVTFFVTPPGWHRSKLFL